jgi:hypothetical protein
MDFMEGFPRIAGKSVILTIIVRFSKMAHFIALSHPYLAQLVARAFFENIGQLHGFPCSIVNDRDPSSLATFGKSCSILRASSCSTAPPSIRRRTHSLRSLTASSSCICGVLQAIIHVLGCSGYRGWNTASISLSSPPSVLLLLRLPTAVPRRPCCLTQPAQPERLLWTGRSVTVTCSWKIFVIDCCWPRMS